MRIVAVFAVILAALIATFAVMYKQRLDFEAQQQARIDELTKEVSQLQAENESNKAALAKVEQEENRLASENQILLKELEQAKITGKLPKTTPLPYPPK